MLIVYNSKNKALNTKLYTNIAIDGRITYKCQQNKGLNDNVST